MVQWIHSIMKVYRSEVANITKMLGVQIVPSPPPLVKYGTKGLKLGAVKNTKKPYLVWLPNIIDGLLGYLGFVFRNEKMSPPQSPLRNTIQ